MRGKEGKVDREKDRQIETKKTWKKKKIYKIETKKYDKKKYEQKENENETKTKILIKKK